MAKKATPAAPAATTTTTAAPVAPNANAAVTLAAVVEATQAGNFLYVPAETSKEWLDNELVEVNTGMVNEAGLATRATPKGIAHMNDKTETNAPASGAAAPAASAGSNKPKFVISFGPPPVTKRDNSSNAGVYPFNDLPAPNAEGQVARFFVPATAARPEPWASLQSTVSSASARFRKETGSEKYMGKETVKDAAGKPVLGEDGKPQTREVEKERKTYEYERQFRVEKGVDTVRDDAGNVVNNEDGTPKTVEGAWVSRVI